MANPDSRVPIHMAASLDGFIARKDGRVDWLETSDEFADGATMDPELETVLDCGLFHAFDGEERPRYAASLASVTEHVGTLYLLCFSDEGPETGCR